MIKKLSIYQGLDKYAALINDTSVDSPLYFRLKDVPTTLTGGKNLIKVRVNNNSLKIGTDIKFEILDYNGDPIHTEFNNYISEDGESYVISIYIYNDTPPGIATMYMVGVATHFPTGETVSQQYNNSYNIKWSSNVLIAPERRNSTDIIFEKDNLPSASIQEVVSPYLQRTFPAGQETVTFDTGQISYQLLKDVPVIQLQGAQFSASMIQGVLTVDTPQKSYPDPDQGTIDNVKYTTQITKVLNSTNILVDTPYEVKLNDSSVKTHVYKEFGPSDYSISYKDTPTYVATQNSMSYARITLHDLEPITGDIYRIKTFRQSPGVISTWQLVDDTILESSELLIDNTNINVNKKTGFFETVSDISYWTEDNTDNTLSPAPSQSFETTPLNNSLKIEGAAEIPDRESIRLLPSIAPQKYFKKGDYVLQFDAYTEQAGDNSEINIFMSGSSFDFNGTEKINGKKIGSITTKEKTARYDDYKIEFEADADGEGTVIFEIKKGTWYFSDISMKSGQETGFNPNSTTIIIPIETQMIGDKLDFKFEYFDYENNQSSHTTYLNDQTFVGGNTYIDGGNNLLTGSLFIGRKFGEGIEQTGKSSGVIKSTGYQGFYEASASTGPAGFMIWSGSATPGGSLTTYQGVGIEAIANSESYFRYSTDANQIDIRTDKFFLGNHDSFISGSNGNIQLSGSKISLTTPNFFLGSSDMYISGSNGVLEISSSRFHVSSSGELKAVKAEFDETCLADGFAYRNKIIAGPDDECLQPYVNSGDSHTYYRLNLTGSSAAHFVRFNFDPVYPIGEINIFNTFGGRGSWIIIEPGTDDVYLAANKVSPDSPSTSKNIIGFDASNGDWAKQSFINTTGSHSNTALYRIDFGDRVQLQRGFQDWKVQNASAYNSGPVFFKKGISIGSGNAPGSAAADGQQGQTAWDNNYFYICIATDTWRRIAHSTW